MIRARTTFSLFTVLAASTLLGCGYDAPTIVGSCPSGSEAGEFHIWRDSISLHPRSPSRELLSTALWQGVEPTMPRGEVEALLAQYLQSRKTYWSEFNTPLGKLRWSLDREASGGDEVRIPRIYLYPKDLSLNDVLDADVVRCLQTAAPKAKYVVVMYGNDSQRATLVVDGLTIKQVIWRQTRI